MQKLILLLTLLSFVSFTVGDSLTKLTKSAILQEEWVLYTKVDVWYRSVKNETVRLSQQDKPLPLPEPLLPFKTVFVELTNNRVLMYADLSSASTPFYVTDGTAVTRYTHDNFTSNTKLEKILYASSHGNEYVLAILSQRGSYVLQTTCLTTGEITTLDITGITYYDNYIVSAAGSFWMNTRNDFTRYDPYSKTRTSYDKSPSFGSSISVVGDFVIFESDFNVETKIDTKTGTATRLNIPNIQGFILQARAIPSPSDPRRFAFGSTGKVIVCPGESDTCTLAPVEYLLEFAQIPNDKIALVDRNDLTKVISYSFNDSKIEEVYPHLEMNMTNSRTVVGSRFMQYHAASDSLFILGAEVTSVWRDDRASSINLLRVDLKKKTLNVTNLCSVPCYIDNTLLRVREDKVFVIKYADGERHLYEVTTKAPRSKPSSLLVIFVLVAGLVVGALTLLVAAIGAVYWIRKQKTNKKNKNTEPYAAVQEL